nr:PREDICTED: CTL-like protein 2 isoform X1 [Bemisia tabaci]
MSKIVDEVYGERSTRLGLLHGKKLDFEPNFKGPRKHRSCTDLCCLLVFVAFLVSWGALGFYAFKHGDITPLILPSDTAGRVCGVDPEVVSRRKLFFFDLSQCAKPNVVFKGCKTPQVCVEQCPKENWAADPYINQLKPANWPTIQKQLICTKPEIANSVNSLSKLKSVIDENLCARYYIKSHSIAKRCIPTLKDIKSANDFLKENRVNWTDLTDGAQAIQYYEKARITAEKVFDDLKISGAYIIYGALAALVISVFYIILLRWLSGIMIWLSLLSFIVILSFSVFLCYGKYVEIKNSPKSEFRLPPSIINRSIEDYIEAFNNNEDIWFWAMIVIGIALVITFSLIICLRKRIRIAIALIKEGSKAIGSSLTSLIFPLFPWILDILVISWAAVVFFYLYSLGKSIYKVEGLSNSSDCVCTNSYKDGDLCTLNEWKLNCHNKFSPSTPCLDAKCAYSPRESDRYIDYLHLYNLFGLLWGMAFVSGFSQMVLAGVFATWYWTLHKRDVPYFVICGSLARTIRYHLGTIAFGSLLIAICGYIRIMIEYIQKTCKKYQDSSIAKAVIWCFRCFFTFLDAVLRFISRNAYIMCAIHGSNFTRSAKDAFGLLSRNAIRVVVLDQVTSLLFFIGKVVITGIMVGIMYYFLMIRPNDVMTSLNYPGVPIIFVAIFSFLIASMFFKVYTMAIETLFLCFCEDSERNDGTANRPYYMSKSLRKILHRHNEPSVA